MLGDWCGLVWLEYFVNEVMCEVKFLWFVFVVMEGYVFGKGDRVYFLGEFGGVLKCDFYQYNMEMVIVLLFIFKKFMIGVGNLGKLIMICEIFRCWGLMIDGDDEVDVMVVVIMGWYKRGFDVFFMIVKM